MKLLTFFVGWLLLPLLTFSNAAMPGVWQGGAGARFVPLLASDSAALRYISMQREEVLVHLYNGFAVVKGTYWMKNRSDQPISMLVGYPVDGTVNAPVVSNIILGTPMAFKVLVNGQPISTASGEAGISQLAGAASAPDFAAIDPASWIVWRTQFAPSTVTTLTVYFLVNCSQARLRKGYSVKRGHAFAYVLESGRAWAGGIDTGSVKIKLKDGLTIKGINGMLPSNVWKGQHELLSWNFYHLEPNEQSNLLIWYNAGKDSIDFENAVLPKASMLFAEIDQFDNSAFADADNWPAIHKENFSPGIGLFGAVFGGMIGFVLLSIMLIAGFFVFIVRRRKNVQKIDEGWKT